MADVAELILVGLVGAEARALAAVQADEHLIFLQMNMWQEGGEARKQARHAAQEAARGKTRAELRDLYIAELRARGQQVPPERTSFGSRTGPCSLG